MTGSMLFIPSITKSGHSVCTVYASIRDQGTVRNVYGDHQCSGRGFLVAALKEVFLLIGRDQKGNSSSQGC